jgi:hypothetical protein
MEGNISVLSFAEMQKNPDSSTLVRFARELRLVADNCPNCQGAREYIFPSRGRENVVNCVRCEALYKLMEPLEVALEIILGGSPY